MSADNLYPRKAGYRSITAVDVFDLIKIASDLIVSYGIILLHRLVNASCPCEPVRPYRYWMETHRFLHAPQIKATTPIAGRWETDSQKAYLFGLLSFKVAFSRLGAR